ncbi:MAG: DUF1523 family protein [Litoreibacter sp.]|nr:DUF1523 family protein [Litoreibacter sp.]
MTYVKWGFWAIFWLLIAAFFHYTLPQRDIVYITGVEIKREDFGENSIFWASPDTGADASGANRDVRFMDTVRHKNGRVMVYRNEDTGWNWPPYFKLDSSNLQAEARNLISTRDNPQWVVLTHYGWRNEFMTIFPNAVSVRPVSDPEVRLIPYFNIIILVIFAGLCLFIYRRWQKFRAARIDPLLEDAAESWDAIDESTDAARGRLSGWWRRLRGKP